jgi:hypothetical protein
VRVHPTLLPEGSVLARVSGVFNAISVTGDVVGTTLYIGRGAGQDATASAVISDIADAVALILHGKGAHLMGEEGPAGIRGPGSPRRSGSAGATTSVDGGRPPGVLARVATVMARHRMSIASVIQNPSEREGAASLVLTTHESDERSMRGALRRLGGLGACARSRFSCGSGTSATSRRPLHPMARIVQKYGGTSVGDVESIKKVAERIKAARDEGNEVVVVVSARAGVTNELIARAKGLCADPSERELDQLLAIGEQETIALMAMALHGIGCPRSATRGPRPASSPTRSTPRRRSR